MYPYQPTIPCGFSSGCAPCATSVWRSSVDSCEIGAYPAAFGLAAGTVVRSEMSFSDAPTAAAKIAAPASNDDAEDHLPSHGSPYSPSVGPMPAAHPEARADVVSDG